MERGALILTAADVDAVLSPEACIEAVEAAFRRLGLGEVASPGVLGVHVENGGFHIKTATLAGARHYFAAKTNGNFPGNPAAHGLPSIQGVIACATRTTERRWRSWIRFASQNSERLRRRRWPPATYLDPRAVWSP